MKTDHATEKRSTMAAPGDDPFVPFDRAAIWDHQRECLAAYDPREEAAAQQEVATPALARAHAETVFSAWCDALDAGRLDPGAPLVILELMSGNGRYATSLLTAIGERVSDTALSGYQILYLLSDPRPQRLSACWNHPALWPWLEQGRLDTVCFDPEQDRHLDVESRRLVFGPQSLANPLVVIANGVFSALRQSLYHAHFGQCHEGLLQVAVRDDRQFDPDCPGAVMELDYDWREPAGVQPYQELLDGYVADLDSNPLLVPGAAMGCLDRLAELCCDGMLVLSADRGYHTDQQLRAQAAPEFGTPGRYFLPLNGHALARYATMRNGAALQTQTYDNSVLYSALWIGGPGSPGPRAGTAFERSFVTCSPDDHRVLQYGLDEHAAALTPAQILSHLRLSAWDSRVLAVCLPSLLQRTIDFTPAERLQWIEVLQRVWRGYYPIGGEPDFVSDFALLAMQLGAWGLARRCLESSDGSSDRDCARLYHLALCCLHTEDLTTARSSIDRAAAAEPDNPDVLALAQLIQGWDAYRDGLEWYDPALCNDGELSIQPLGSHHAVAVLFQLRDPNITVQTCLPAWRDEAEFAEWVAARQNDASEACYAVIHKVHGFVGMVDLRWHGDTGFFYFWIGADYQGRGFGPRAARLLFNLAEDRLGIAKIYTTAFRDNQRSQRALSALGFGDLPFQALEPNQDAAFFRRGAAEEDAARVLRELVDVLHAIDSPIVVREQLQGKAHPDSGGKQ